ncbi:MAG: DUF3240 family protein [Pseudomonadales bacterium]
MSPGESPADAAAEVLIVISAPPGLGDAVTDFLLEQEDGGFTSFAVAGHSSRHDHFSVAEQVRGHEGRVRFEAIRAAGSQAGLIERLCAQFAGADIHYWVLPVLGSGRMPGAVSHAED